jgi:spore coat polysaccharide biosynthesis protein SpsF
MGSTRLPGKVLMPIRGRHVLWHVLNRLKYSTKINKMVLAIPDSESDSVLELFARKYNVNYYRGSEDDVLSRYYNAAAKFSADTIVRITADCPLIDPRVVDSMVECYFSSGVDYVYSGEFPYGLGLEVFNFSVLKKAYEDAVEPYDREHVSPYIYHHPNLFSVKLVEAIGKLRRPELRLTVDTKEDLELVKEIFNRMYKEGQIFYAEDVIDLLDEHPELVSINSHIVQKELR